MWNCFDKIIKYSHFLFLIFWTEIATHARYGKLVPFKTEISDPKLGILYVIVMFEYFVDYFWDVTMWWKLPIFSSINQLFVQSSKGNEIMNCIREKTTATHYSANQKKINIFWIKKKSLLFPFCPFLNLILKIFLLWLGPEMSILNSPKSEFFFQTRNWCFSCWNRISQRWQNTVYWNFFDQSFKSKESFHYKRNSFPLLCLFFSKIIPFICSKLLVHCIHIVLQHLIETFAQETLVEGTLWGNG